MDENKNKNSSKLEILDTSTKDILDKLIQETNSTTTKELIDIFNLNIAKSNAVRIAFLNGLLDKVNNQAAERFEKCPDEISNKDLLDYMTTVQNQIEKAQNTLNTTPTQVTPSIHLTNQTNEVNINLDPTSNLDRESKRRVIEAINALLKESQKEVIDVDVMDQNDNEQNGEK